MAKPRLKKMNNAQVLKVLESHGYTFKRNTAKMINECVLNGKIRVMHDGVWGELYGLARSISHKYGEEWDTESTIKHAIREALHKNAYNPIKLYLHQSMKQYQGENTLSEFLSCIHVNSADEEAKNIFFTKWLMGCVARVITNFQNYTLVICGGQGIGKSSLFRYLCSGVGVEYFKSGVIRPSDKDHRLALAQNFIWCADEFSSILKTADRNLVKDFLSLDGINDRAPYAMAAEYCPRNCSIAGTVNDAEFLTDPTGNRRYLIIPEILSIDLQQIKLLNVNSLWGQIATKFVNEGENSAMLTEGEIALQNVTNEEAYVQDPLEHDLQKWFRPNPGGFVRSSEIIEKIRTENGANLSFKDRVWSMKISESMQRLGFQKVRNSGARGYSGIEWVTSEAPYIPAPRLTMVKKRSILEPESD